MGDSKTLKYMAMSCVAILVLGIIALVGNAIMDRWQYTVRDSTTVTKTGLVLLNNTNVATGYSYLQTINSCFNASNSSDLVPAAKMTAVEGDRTTSYILLDATDDAAKFDNYTSVNCSLTYLASNDQSDVAILFESGLAYFAIFCGLLVLAVVGKIVIGVLKKKD